MIFQMVGKKEERLNLKNNVPWVCWVGHLPVTQDIRWVQFPYGAHKSKLLINTYNKTIGVDFVLLFVSNHQQGEWEDLRRSS